MRKRPPNFGERVTNLRIAYGSQRKLAESLGVSIRTIQRWEKRDKAPRGSTKLDPVKVTRRERYVKERFERVVKAAPVARAKAGRVLINDYIPGAIAAAQVPQWLLENRPQIMHDILSSGKGFEVYITTIGKEVWVTGNKDPLNIRTQGTTRRYRFDAPGDFIEFESRFWDQFRRAYGKAS